MPEAHDELGEAAEQEARPAAEDTAPEAGGTKVGARSILWPILLSVAALAAVGYFTFDPAAFRDALRRLDPWFLAAAVAMVLVRVAAGGWRLNYLSRGRLGLRAGTRSQIAWDFFSYVTPSTVGGGPFASVFISRDRKMPLGEATSLILFAMLLDQVSLALTIPVLILCAPFVDVFPAALGTVGTGALGLFFFGYTAWVLLFAYGTLIRPQVLTWLIGGMLRIRWLRRFKTRALRVLSELQARSVVLRKQPLRFYAKGFGLTLVPWISRYLLAVFVIRSVYSGADELLIFLRAAALNLGTLALPTPGGAGGAEGLYVLFFGPGVMPSALVAPTLLVWRLLTFYVFILAGVFVTMRSFQRRAL